MKKKILFPILIIFLLINNCGFKIVNKSEIYKFDINEIIATGDNRINFKIKNKLKFSSEKNGKKLVNIYLGTNKTKEIKEKNINNEITKYQISINATVKVKELVSEKEVSFIISKTGDYNVSSQYSQTRASEKKLINILTDDITENILEAIGLKLDDL